MPSSRRQAASARRAGAASRPQSAARRQAVKRPAAVAKRPSRFSFVTDTISEMKKVTWLSRREALYLSGLVLLVAALVGAILGVIDLGFSALVETLLLGG